MLDKGDDEWVRLATVSFTANEEGSTTVSLGAPTDTHDNMTRTDGIILSTEQIDYGSAVLEVLQACPMDIDGDGYIGVSDYTLLSKAWRTSPGNANWNPACDIDSDGYVGVSDYTFLSRNWRKYTTDPDLVFPGANATAAALSSLEALTTSESAATANVRLVAVSSKTSSDTAASVPTSLTQVSPGDSFFVEIWVRNINGHEGSDLCGLTGGYLNMNYSSDLLRVDEITYGSVYSQLNNLQDASTAGSISLIGGVAAAGVLDVGDDEWVRLATVTFTAVGTGDASITSLAPNDFHDNLTLTSGKTLVDSKIDFGSLNLLTVASSSPSNADVTIDGKKVTVTWEDASPAADSVRYRAVGEARWTTKKLKAGETSFSFNAQAGTNYEIEVLLDQSETNVLQASAVLATKDQLFLASEPSDALLVTTME